MRRGTVSPMILVGVLSIVWTASAETKLDQDKAGVSLVSTFHCISIYWSPAQGGPEREVSVKFRATGQKQWRPGLPLRYHPVDTSECKADYRSSLVNLTPGTTYDIVLTLDGTHLRTKCRGTTWGEEFPVASTAKVSDRDTTLTVNQSGRPDAYVYIQQHDSPRGQQRCKRAGRQWQDHKALHHTE